MNKILETLKKYWLFGALLGAVFPYILSILGRIPGIAVTQSTIALTVADVNTGLASWAFNVFGAQIGFPEILMGAIGGILFIALGALVVNVVKIDKILGIKGKLGKTALILFIAGLSSGFILDMSLALPGIAVIVTQVIGAIILGFILVTLDDLLKLKVIPE